jgi:cytochrome P450
MQKTQIIKDIEDSMILAGIRLELPLVWALISHVPLPRIGRPVALFDRFAQYGQIAVRNTKAAAKASIKTLFTKMIPEEGEQPLTDLVVSMESANIIIAGADTTANAITYLVYEVLGHPDVKRKLLWELDTCSSDPGWEELEAKPYISNVISETLRRHPPIAGSLPRCVPKGGATLAGYRIPEGAVVDTQAYSFHLDPKVWPDPLTYVHHIHCSRTMTRRPH